MVFFACFFGVFGAKTGAKRLILSCFDAILWRTVSSVSPVSMRQLPSSTACRFPANHRRFAGRAPMVLAEFAGRLDDPVARYKERYRVITYGAAYRPACI